MFFSKRDEYRKNARKDSFFKISAVKEEKKTISAPLVKQSEYSVKIPYYSFVAYKRDYSDITRRYSHLHISPDFTKIVSKWIEVSYNG